MDDSPSHLNKQQRKKERRKQQKQRERGAHHNLDAVTSLAIEQALLLAHELTTGAKRTVRSAKIDVPLASHSEALFVRKRLNDALKVDEWLDEVQVVLHETTTAVELRIERLL